ncbi:cell-division protein [[Clostridium] sordellii]|uniref:cell division protein ZapA n=1 Tax=Paraclostridium sordellii TaxID=1505 RepID=UPI0005E07F71|nr:cell division protein ZapA [Paeniclostridium sordellii]MDU4414571.1 cell division protein ZapA [Paeniclostridium sordellii]MDU6480705.1 cell division protein ZapA [Paeniclostridium sordellii]MRZ27172.1 cell division protein ZapA [Paeniclostridium sordellii]MVO73127.1 cell division protein ZapA [Paeniclostridium sordellii]CEO36728.1 cell-division protein [[Clostridium] sordellii] [Paeniclostridium sordellii]
MNKVTVKIHGSEYPMVSEKSKDYMIKIAHYVDEEMSRISEANPLLSTSQVAILSALTVTDLLFECSEENDKLSKANEELAKKAEKPNQEVQLEMKKIKLELDNRVEELGKKQSEIDALKSELDNKANNVEEINLLKKEIEKLKNNLDEANEKTEIAEKLASDFQNKLYDLQLKNIELEQELNYIKASGKLLK